MAVRRPPGSAGPGEPGLQARRGPDWREQYGRGNRDPVTGLYEWYEIPPEVREYEDQPELGWLDLLAHWTLIEADLHSEYGIDVEDRALIRARSWRWLQARILGLLSVKSRLRRALKIDQEADDGVEAG